MYNKTKQLYQQLWYIHALIQPTLTVNIPSIRANNLYLTTHNTHKRWMSMYLAEFEPAISASQRLQTHALD
jgi:hypothetical protein